MSLAVVTRVAKVAGPAEEAREEIEGVVAPAGCGAPILMGFKTFGTVAVVDPAGFGIREGRVGFSYFAETFGRGGVITI